MSLSKRMALVEKCEQRKKEPVPRSIDYLEEFCPVLLEMLTKIPDGSADHKTATVLILCEEGEFKVCVNDRAIGRKAWCRLETLDEQLLLRLEEIVSDEVTDWRFPRPGTNGRY